jgi:glutathione S-transferase
MKLGAAAALRPSEWPDDMARAAAEAVMRDIGGRQAIGPFHDHIEKVRATLHEHIEKVHAAVEAFNAKFGLINERLARIETTIKHQWWLVGAVFLMQLGALFKAAFWG